MADQKLLPCPFCRSAAEVKSAAVDGKEYSNVSCSKTTCPGFNNISHQRATKLSVKLWNTRTAGAGEWITTNGKKPDLPDGTLVDVKFLDGRTEDRRFIDYWTWTQDGDSADDITHYRIHRTAPDVQGEPVGVIRESDVMGIAPYADIWAWLEPGTKLYTAPQPALDVKGGPVAPSRFVNAAGINASDAPATVIRKLDSAFHDVVTFADDAPQPDVQGEPEASRPLHPSQVRALRRNVKRNCPPEIYALLDQAITAPQPAPDEQYPPCDFCGVIPDHHPWHGSGMLKGIDSPHIHACNDCRPLLPSRTAPDASALVEALEWLRGAINCTPENDKHQIGAWISTKHPRIRQIDELLAARRKGGDQA